MSTFFQIANDKAITNQQKAFMNHFHYKGSVRHRVLKAGVAPRKAVYSGVGK
jgi:hypothetical protein